MPRLILHAGSHKTGTTSIQTVLADNRQHLRANAIFFPDGFRAYPWPQVGHHAFSHGLTGVSLREKLRARMFVAAMRRERRPHETVLLSAEPIYRHQHGRGEHDYAIDPATYWSLRRRYLQTIRRALKGFDIEVLLYLRGRDRLAESWYWHRLREHGAQTPFPAFLDAFEPWFDYERQVALFREVFDSVRIESYEDACASPGGLIPHFFRTIGCAPPPIAAEPRERTGAYGGDAFGTPEARAAFLGRYPAGIPR